MLIHRAAKRFALNHTKMPLGKLITKDLDIKNPEASHQTVTASGLGHAVKNR